PRRHRHPPTGRCGPTGPSPPHTPRPPHCATCNPNTVDASSSPDNAVMSNAARELIISRTSSPPAVRRASRPYELVRSDHRQIPSRMPAERRTELDHIPSSVVARSREWGGGWRCRGAVGTPGVGAREPGGRRAASLAVALLAVVTRAGERHRLTPIVAA